MGDMSRIPAGAGSAGDPKFNELIATNINKCQIMIGILSSAVANSHPRWGCPAEWKLALKSSKKLIVLDLYEESENAKTNQQVKEVHKVVQFQELSERPSMFRAVTRELIEVIRAELVS